MACCHLLTPHTLEVPLMLVPIWGKISSSDACWLAAKMSRAKKSTAEKITQGRTTTLVVYI